jgi:hypothetical protein
VYNLPSTTVLVLFCLSREKYTLWLKKIEHQGKLLFPNKGYEEVLHDVYGVTQLQVD